MSFRDFAAWRLAKASVLDPARRFAMKAGGLGRLPLQWCRSPNWGDALSPALVERISGKKVIYAEGLHLDRYLVIGSILGSANEHAEVWGSGFIREDETVVSVPRSVHAVRGPLSRQKLIAQGVDCPDVFGDPALLLPKFFNPDVERKYSVGIIPHYVDKGCDWLERFRQDPGILIIDIEGGIASVVKAVKSCDAILSSSLHGLICADAYGVPSAWIQLSTGVDGGAFKFRDYRLSVGSRDPEPVRVTEASKISDALRHVEAIPLQIDLGALLLACPFLSKALEQEARRGLADLGRLPDVFTSATLDWDT